MEDRIKQNAELVIRQMSQVSGFDFGYDAQSVAWLDGYIERRRVRADITPEVVNGLVSVFGSYLGECVIRCYGGYWENEDGQWRVSFDRANAVYPFTKVQKQFQNGPEDSIKSFFEVIPVVFTPASSRGVIEKRSWWRFW
ncbi:MAG TPA: hypothetical protein VF656_15285 [Pyrinomonadaceae bacterium]|jgi:hypothetical protein